MKVMTIVGTRPEVIKLSRVIAELDKHVKHVLVHTGQNYDHELNGIFFEEMGLRSVDYQLSCFGTSPMVQIGTMLQSVSVLLEREAPDAVLLLGDTNSCLAAYAAKRRHIPIFHMEAGNRCFDQRVPEEVNRKIVDHVSDINMPYTEHARRNLLAEGIPADRIIKTGSPMAEVLEHYYPQIYSSTIRDRLGLKPRSYYVVSAHREENVDDTDRLEKLTWLVNYLGETGVPVVFSVHPRTRERLKQFADQFFIHDDVLVSKPFGFFDYVRLQSDARCVISDSGTLTEEAGMLGFPAVMIRQAHERPEGMDEGTAVMSDLDIDSVEDALKLAISKTSFTKPADYYPHDVAYKVVNTILSYTDYVQRVVWRRS